MVLPKLTIKGLRTVGEMRAQIPIGGSCWVIYADYYTQEPKGVEQFTRVNAVTFTSVKTTDEERMHEYKTAGQILKQPYGGAWLKKGDAVTYLKLLKALWKRVPEVIEKLAQEHEDYTVH